MGTRLRRGDKDRSRLERGRGEVLKRTYFKLGAEKAELCGRVRLGRRQTRRHRGH